MRRDVGLIGGIVALLFLVGAAHATIWYVHPDSALNSIQAGLDSCANNDTVRVGPGTYVENIVWPNTQGIHLISELGPEMTIIDGNSDGSVIRIATAVDTATIINGFTIQNGDLHISGGGIYCYNNSSPTITGNTITNNHAHIRGAGIYCGSGCSPIISDNAITNNAVGGPIGGAGGGIFCDSNSLAIILDNTITNNIALSSWEGNGGGIYCRNYNGMINGNTVTGNYALYYGGGIYCYWGSPEIRNNTIADNTADWGGGIFCTDNSSPTIDSCTIANNTGDGIYCQGGFYHPEIHYNDIFSNTPYGVRNINANVTVNAGNNWWGDSTGPYHPDSNPGGLGDTVSDYVDFIPWLYWPGVEEQPIVKPVEDHTTFTTTIFSGPLQLPEGKKCKVFDITGRVVAPDKIQPGIYFIEIDGQITQKVVKVR